MPPYTLDLAGPSDDGALRLLLAGTPMRGAISLAFAREPSYLAAQSVAGPLCQTLVARDGAHIVGMGERSIRDRYLNGQSIPVGYLGSLRLLDTHRSATLMARGFRYFRQLHEDHRAAFYLTTIANDNTAAKSLLTSRRAGLPTYRFAGFFHTFALSLRGRRHAVPHPFTIRSATPEDLPALVEHLHRVGANRHFFPVCSAADFLSDTATFRNLSMPDILIALDGSRIVGTMGAWDQHLFRQERIAGYGPLTALTRPVYNVLAGLRGLPRLPTAGSTLRPLMAALPVVEQDNPTLFLALLHTLLHARSGRSWDNLLVGMHESDPLLPALRTLPARSYTTGVYLVYWDRPPILDTMDSRPWYFELGTL